MGYVFPAIPVFSGGLPHYSYHITKSDRMQAKWYLYHACFYQNRILWIRFLGVRRQRARCEPYPPIERREKIFLTAAAAAYSPLRGIYVVRNENRVDENDKVSTGEQCSPLRWVVSYQFCWAGRCGHRPLRRVFRNGEIIVYRKTGIPRRGEQAACPP